MSDPEVPTTSPSPTHSESDRPSIQVTSKPAAGPWKPTLPLFVLVAVLAFIFLITTFVEMGAAGSAKAAAARDVKEAQDSAAKMTLEAKQTGLNRTAAALAASLEPIIVLKGTVPEITDRTLQAVCQNMLKDGKYKFVAITDSQGNVHASSDLALLGKPLPASTSDGGTLTAAAMIGSKEANYGTVSLRIDP